MPVFLRIRAGRGRPVKRPELGSLKRVSENDITAINLLRQALVMRGLGPRIHMAGPAPCLRQGVDDRDEPGHDRKSIVHQV